MVDSSTGTALTTGIHTVKGSKAQSQASRHSQGFSPQIIDQSGERNQAISLEDLNVSGMLKNRCVKPSLKNLDVIFVVISRGEPTSQICSDRGYRWGKLDLSVRELVCINYGTHQDRDANVAKNIEKARVSRA
jgi:putative transposase